jgi:ABC-type lipoprotein export system ATPase subunit
MSFIQTHQLVKTYQTPAGQFTALKGINLTINQGEFVAVIGKSGSGKSTFINSLTGIDRPTSGEIWIGGTAVHTLNENQMAAWRGRNLGIVFQFFQLMPTLTLLENIMLPMDLNRLYKPAERAPRALALLDRVGMADHAHKLPAAVSGGQQQRVAIARALANDPPLIVADEPTGNLDSKTAAQVFELFTNLVAGGKTIVMVTHDDTLARSVHRTILIADGEVVNEYLVRALSALNHDHLVEVTQRVTPLTVPAGTEVVCQGEVGDKFYIIVSGTAEVLINRPGGGRVVVDHRRQGEYFGEMALLGDGRRSATVRAAPGGELTLVALDKDTFNHLINESRPLRDELGRIVDKHRDRLEQHV